MSKKTLSSHTSFISTSATDTASSSLYKQHFNYQRNSFYNMSKNIRQKIVHAIQTTFRSSPQNKQSHPKSKLSSCCSVSKPQDYEFIPYQPKQSSSTKNDYIDLSECHSWSLSYSRDSGVSVDTNISSVSSNSNCHQLQSTRILSDDSCSLSTVSDLSSIPHDYTNISNLNITAWHSIPQTFVCCHCQCHHHVENNNHMTNYLYVPEQYQKKQTKNEIFPFIF